MDEEDYLVPYKDITELKKELEEIQGKKDISIKDIHEAVVKLAHALTDMLEVFGAATEQMQFEEKEYESNTRKHEMIIAKLDKLIDQNKTIAEAMVGVVEVVKEKLGAVKEREESFFKPKPEPKPFMRPQTEWQPKPEQMMPRAQPMMQQMEPPMPSPIPMPSFGMQQMPPMQPEPSPELPDFDFPEEPSGLEEEPKKKGLFGMFKK